jgi:four helix bundle protein
VEPKDYYVMKINRFEELEVWQLSRTLVKEIYKVTNEGQFKKDFALRDQIRRAGLSVMSNIAEGFERKTKNELIQFLFISKGSSGEVRSQLYVSFDLKYLTDKQFSALFELAEKVSRSISGFIKYLNSTKNH